MRVSAKFFGLLLLTCVFVAAAPSTLWAQKQGGLILTTDPNATGTRLSGVLTIYYERLHNPFVRALADQCIVGEVNMFFFLRLATQKQIFGFSGLEQSHRDAKLCIEETTLQDAILRQFFRDKVVPLLATKGSASSPTAAFAVRSVTNVAQETQTGDFAGSLSMVIMDIEVAVK